MGNKLFETKRPKQINHRSLHYKILARQEIIEEEMEIIFDLHAKVADIKVRLTALQESGDLSLAPEAAVTHLLQSWEHLWQAQRLLAAEYKRLEDSIEHS
jgi:hypothetical protein